MNVAIIGCGFVSEFNVKAWQRLDHKVVAVCDLNKVLAGRLAQKCGCFAYTDFKQMLEQQSIDAVSICTPPSSHSFILGGVLEYDFVKVFVEKPFTVTSAQASAFKSSKQVAVFHTQLYSPNYYFAWKAVKEGLLGKVSEVNMKLYATPDDYMTRDSTNWSHKMKGGRIAECLPHPIYLVQAFSGLNDFVVRDVEAYKPKLPMLKHLSFSELFAVLDGGCVRATVDVRLNMPVTVNCVSVVGEYGVLDVGVVPEFLCAVSHGGKMFHVGNFLARLKFLRSSPRMKIISELLSGDCFVNAEHAFYNVKAVEQIVEKIAC